jgi:hypothetical protein
MKTIFNSMLLPFMALIVSPFTFYFVNINEYQLGLPELVKYSLVAFISTTILFVFFSSILGRWRKYFFVVVIALSLIVWVQSQVLVWDFGPLDGRGVDWGKWSNHAIFEIIFYIVIFGLLFFLLRRNEKLQENLIIGLFLMGFYSLASGWIAAPDRIEMNIQDVSKTGLDAVSFSQDKNKILIVLDTFQSNAFQAILNQHPEEVEFLKDFVFFPNTLGGYPTTQPSIPMMLSGNIYKNEKPIDDWTKETNQNSKFSEVHEQASRFVSLTPSTLAGISSRVYSVGDFKEENVSVKFLSYVKVLDGGFFKLLPTLVKKPYYSEGNWFFTSLIEKKSPSVDYGFFNYFKRFAHATSTEHEVFRFYHLAGVHFPLQFDENYNYTANMQPSWASYLRQARGVLTQLKVMTDKLKSLGVYESSTILVVGDHGTMPFKGNDFYGQPSEWDFVSDKVYSTGRPLYIVKKPRDESLKYEATQRSIAVLDDPKYLKDVMCEFSNDESCFDDYSVRNFYFYDWTKDYHQWKKEFLPPITPYIVIGDVRDLSSWKKSEERFSNGEVFVGGNFLKIDSVIEFSDRNRLIISNIIISGWSAPEPSHYWTEGSIARLKFNSSDCARSITKCNTL